MVNEMDDQYIQWKRGTSAPLFNASVYSLNGSMTFSLLFPSSLRIPQLESSLPHPLASSSSASPTSYFASSSVPLITSSTMGTLRDNETLESSTATLYHSVVNNLLSDTSVLVTVNEATSNLLSSSSLDHYNTTRIIASHDNTSRLLHDESNTSGGSERVPLSVEILMYIMYISVIIAALGGNGIVSFLILAYSKMRTVTNFFILNLAIGDILMACTCIPFTFVANFLLQTWIFGETMCIVVSYCQAVSVFVSAYTLVAISIDRYIAIIYPLRPRMTKFQAKLIIGLIWLVSLATPLPTALFSKLIFPHEEDMSKIFCNEDWGKNEYRYYYSMLLMVLQYVFPLSVLVFTYTRIALVVWGKQTPGEAEDGRDQRLAASKRKMVKMMITCVTVFTLCWLPLNVLVIINDQYPEINQFQYIMYVWFSCHFLAMSHASYNPIIYIWMNSRFRDGFKYILSQMLPCFYRPEHMSTPDFLPHNLTTNTGHFNFAHSTTKLVSHVNSHQIHNRGSSSQSVSPCIRHDTLNNNDNNHLRHNSDGVVHETITIPEDADADDDHTHKKFVPSKSTFAKVSLKSASKCKDDDIYVTNETASVTDESPRNSHNPSAHQLDNYTSPLASASSSQAKCSNLTETNFSNNPSTATVSSNSSSLTRCDQEQRSHLRTLQVIKEPESDATSSETLESRSSDNNRRDDRDISGEGQVETCPPQLASVSSDKDNSSACSPPLAPNLSAK